MLKEFRAFIMRGNVLDLAVAVIIGGAFGVIIKSLVDDVIMPPIGLLLGNVDFSSLFILLKQGDPAGPYASLADAKAAGAVSINYGAFLNTVITFLIVAFAIFLMLRAVSRMQRPAPEPPPVAPTTKDCPYCFTAIPIQATRCPNCTSQLAG